MPEIAVLLPCYNEEAALSRVIQDFRTALPQSRIYVYDNNSTDGSLAVAAKHAVSVREVREQGKGYVVRAMFRDIDADIYILADADQTYPASSAPDMIEKLISEKADMVCGVRLGSYRETRTRPGHLLGNRILTRAVNHLFDSNCSDLLTGYRVFSRRFVKSIPLFARGFEVEAMLSIHAIEVDAKIIECPIDYQDRPQGSPSKLNTIKDGLMIMKTIVSLYSIYQPLLFYSLASLVQALICLGCGVPVIIEFFETGFVPRFPTAIFASAMGIISVLTFFAGVIIHAISKSRRELKKLAFLNQQN